MHGVKRTVSPSTTKATEKQPYYGMEGRRRSPAFLLSGHYLERGRVPGPKAKAALRFVGIGVTSQGSLGDEPSCRRDRVTRGDVAEVHQVRHFLWECACSFVCSTAPLLTKGGRRMRRVSRSGNPLVLAVALLLVSGAGPLW